MHTSSLELQSSLISKDKLASVTQRATEIVADLHLPPEISNLDTWNFEPSKDLNAGSWSKNIPGPHGETTLEITTYGTSGDIAEVIRANWTPSADTENPPGVNNLLLTITKKSDGTEKREVSIVVDKTGSEGTLTLTSEKDLPVFTPLISEPEPQGKRGFSFRFFNLVHNLQKPWTPKAQEELPCL